MPVIGSSRSFGFSTFKRTMNCWLKMSADVIATLTSASFGTEIFGVLHAVRQNANAHTTAPTNRFITLSLGALTIDLGALGERGYPFLSSRGGLFGER